MALVDFTDFMDLVLAEVRLAPEGLAEQKLRETARDFCQFTRAWQTTGATLTVKANMPTYRVIGPGEAEPVIIEYLAVDTGEGPVESIPLTVDKMTSLFPTWRTTVADDFRYFVQLDRRTFQFCATPETDAGTISNRLSLKPGPESNEIDEDTWSEFSEEIAKGTKAKLMLMEGERWYKAKQGNLYYAEYMRARANARIRVSRSYGRAQEQWVGPKFAGR